MVINEPGIYDLTLMATDSCGNETIATREITVEEEPPSEWIVSFDVSDYTVPNSNPSPLLADWNTHTSVSESITEVVNPMCTMRNGDVVPYTDLANSKVEPIIDIEGIDVYDDLAFIYLWHYDGGEFAGIILEKNGNSFTTNIDNLHSAGLQDVVSIHFDKLAFKYKLT